MTNSGLTPGSTARECILCDFGLVHHEVPVMGSFLCNMGNNLRVQSLLLHLSEWGSFWLFGWKNTERVTLWCEVAAFSWFSYRGWSCPPLRCLIIPKPPCFKETQTGIHGVLCGKGTNSNSVTPVHSFSRAKYMNEIFKELHPYSPWNHDCKMPQVRIFSTET